MDDAAACAAEIVALHEAFVAWLGRGEGGMDRFAAAFDPDFVMVTPDGRRLDRAAVLAFLEAGRGRRGSGFRIAVEEVAALHAAPPLVLMHYVEGQRGELGETARRSSALFRMAAAGPRWLFVQETWIAGG